MGVKVKTYSGYTFEWGIREYDGKPEMTVRVRNMYGEEVAGLKGERIFEHAEFEKFREWFHEATVEPEPKPEPKTLGEALEPYPVGTAIRFQNESHDWTKTQDGWLALKYRSAPMRHMLNDPATRWLFTVRYNPEEA